jgi:uncharacterized protein (DUF1330 family)
LTATRLPRYPLQAILRLVLGKGERKIMKTHYMAALAMLAGAALGAAATQGLHAQAKPTAYVIAEIDVTNPDAYMKEFVPLGEKAILNGGGKYLARGGKTVSFDGEPPKPRTAVLAFENIKKAQEVFTSSAYREARKIGDKYGKFRLFAVEGVSQ